MKLSTTSFFSVLATLGIIAAVSSCSKSDNIAGTWLGSPETLHNVSDAADAVSTMTLDIIPGNADKSSGTVNLMSVLEVSQAVSGYAGSFNIPYETNITATATITGKYTLDDDGEDMLVSFDPASLKVNVDPSGVTFSENLIKDTERPTLDSLTNATVEKWRVILTSAIRDRFNSYRKIEDIKVHHGDMMSCEIADRDLTFRRLGKAN